MQLVKNSTMSYLVLISMVSFLVGCDSSVEDKAELVLRPVRTMIVTSPDLIRSHEFSAVVDASRKADLAFKISGELIELLVKQGDEVTEGQVLARLDDSDVKIQLNEAKSTFEKATSDFNRAKDLIKTSTISQADFDQVQANFNSAKAKYDSAKNTLEYTELKASFDGVIARTYTNTYQEISAKSPIVTLHDLRNINLKISVPESIMIRVNKDGEKPELTAIFEQLDGVVFPLTFKEVSLQADEVTKTYEVTLTMPYSNEYNILPGMTATVVAKKLFPESEFNASYYIPAKSVLKDSKGNFVYVVNRVSEGVGRVSRKEVTVGRITSLGIEIHSGIAEGDNILTAGMSKVSEGLEVKF